jgi:glutathione S-transferase
VFRGVGHGFGLCAAPGGAPSLYVLEHKLFGGKLLPEPVPEETTVKIYYMETMNPRKVCATAKYLKLPVHYVPIDTVPGGLKGPEYLAINPNGRAPTLTDGDTVLWESAAIMMHMAIAASSDLWPVSDPARQVEIMRWVSWDLCEFAPHAGAFYFENSIKEKLGLGAPDRAGLEAKVEPLRASAKTLDAHLADRKYLAGDAVTIADFCVGVLLPYQKEIGLPLADYRNLQRWHAELMKLDAWRNPWPTRRASA